MKCPFCNSQMKRGWSYLDYNYRCNRHKCLVTICNYSHPVFPPDIYLCDFGYGIAIEHSMKGKKISVVKYDDQFKKEFNNFFYFKGRYYDYIRQSFLRLPSDMKITPNNFHNKLKTILTFL